MNKNAMLAGALVAILLVSVLAVVPQYAGADSDNKQKGKKEHNGKPAVFTFIKHDRDGDDDDEGNRASINVLSVQNVTIKAKGLAVERSSDGYKIADAALNLSGDAQRSEGNHARVLLNGTLDIGSKHYVIQAEGKMKLEGKVGTIQIRSNTGDARLQVHGLAVPLQNDDKVWKLVVDPAAKLGGHTRIYGMIGEVQLGIASLLLPATHVNLTIRSADMSGNSLLGLYVNLAQGSTTVASGYTPFTFSIKSNSAYSVTVSDYQDKVFDHWENGSTDRTRAVTLNADTTITAHYRTSSSQSPMLMVNSVGPDGSVRHMWTAIKSGSTNVQAGYTPLNYSGNSGATYTVTVSNYQDLVFERWENGSTDMTRTVTLSSPTTTITAYFKSSAQSSELDHFAITRIGSSQVAGSEFTFAVTAIDGLGRVKTTYAGTVTLTTNDGTSHAGHASVIPAAYTFTAADAGQHVFAARMFNARSDAVITVSGDGRIATSNAFAVAPAQASSVTVTPSSATLGPGGAVTLAAQARDAYGNQIAGATYFWALGVPSLGSLSPSANAATFTAADLAAPASGAVSATATWGGATASGSATVNVNPA